MNLFILLIVLGFPIYCLIKITVSYKRLNNTELECGFSGVEIVRDILKRNNIDNIYIIKSNNYYTRRYDSKRKVIRLKPNDFDGCNISNLAICLNECGRVLQDDGKNVMIGYRKKVDQLIDWLNIAAYILSFWGLIAYFDSVFAAGILLFIVVMLFHFAFLKSEKESNQNVLKELEKVNALTNNEYKQLESFMKDLDFVSFSGIITCLLAIFSYVKDLVDKS